MALHTTPGLRLREVGTSGCHPSTAEKWTSSKRGYLARVNLARVICTVKYYKNYIVKSRRSQMGQIIYLGFGSVKRENGSSNGAVPFTTAKKRKYKYSLCFNVHLHQLKE
jgi:hypothetical protein